MEQDNIWVRICPICGKEFYMSSQQWVFKTRTKRAICTWHCQSLYNSMTESKTNKRDKIVFQYDKKDNLIATYPSIEACARAVDVTNFTIRHAIENPQLVTRKGFKFRTEEI